MTQSASESPLRTPRKRRRTPKSCHECRRCKTKCDRNEPCSHCVLSKTPCVYNSRPTQGNVILGTAPRSLPTETGTPPTTITSAEVFQTPAPSTFPEHHEAVSRECLALNKSRLFGRSHWSNTAAREFRRISAVLNSERAPSTTDHITRSLLVDVRTLLRKCKVLAKNRKIAERSNWLPLPASSISTTRVFSDHMAQSYVSHFESAFRILHIPSFWSEYAKSWNRPPCTEDVFQLKTQLVVAIGSSLYPKSPDDVAPSFRSTACQWVHSAQQWLSAPIRKGRLTTDGLQLHCLLGLAGQAVAIGGDFVYITIGNALRTAIQMGLHRDPKHYGKMTILEGELRRRLWATILELNLQASMDAGVPPNLSLEDFDTEAPSNVDDADIDDQTDALPRYPAEFVTDTSLQRFLSGLMRSRYEIVQRMNGLSSPMSYDEIHTVTYPLVGACRQHKASTKGAGAEANFRQNLADLLLRRLLLCLHRPLAGQSSTHHQFYSRKMSLDAAMAILSPTHNLEFSHLTSVGAGMFKHRMIHTSLAVASELLMELEENGPISEPKGYRKMVVDAVQEALRQIEERIRLGQTNADIKMHMKLNMTLCQAEGVASPGSGSLSQSLAQSAKASLEMSCSILQERIEKPVDEGNGIAFQDSHQDLTFDSDVDFYAIFGAMDFDLDALLGSESMLS